LLLRIEETVPETSLPSEIATVAKLAGLDIALATYPGDIAIAAKAAAGARAALPAVDDAKLQPWPPVHVRKS
jgi:hypothetical protein